MTLVRSWIPLIEAVCLALVAMWAFLLVPTRPLARMFPRVFMALVGALMLWAGGVAVLAAYFPATLHPLTALTVLGVHVEDTRDGSTWRLVQ